ncbi:MAG: transcriptional repressor [Candidatus Pelagibacterales bacterium]|nr:MAG: transcriptional repressor [Pelagibacterales bacterium]
MKQLEFHKERLRTFGLRPTKQRLDICRILFDRKNTFHFTIEKLKKIIEKNNKKKISLATLYNTIHVLKKKGYLKEISLKGNKTFFDTNTKKHHHFYDEGMSQLIDIDDKNISLNYLPKIPNGKKIKSIEVLVKIEKTN